VVLRTKTHLAIHGGKPVRRPDQTWPAWPIFDEKEIGALRDVLESRKWFYDQQVAQFEREYAAFQDARFCISCTSGTTAIEIALQALGIGPGDEVIVPPYTFIATASAVLRVGATPIFVDVDSSWCMDPNLIEPAITPRTKAIMPVHFGGRICDMDRIPAIADKHGLPVIEDACHSWGGKWEGKGTGALGRCGVFSFQASKNITAGEGGAILTDEADLAALCKSLVNCGRTPDGPWYHHVNAGTNARLTEFGAAILRAQMTRLEAQTLLRERNAALLYAELSEVDGIIPQPSSNRITRRAYHLYCMRIDEARFGCSRARFIEAAQAEGLPVSAGYPIPLYKQPVFERCRSYDYKQCRCPVAEDLCYNSGMWFAHSLLLGSENDMRDIAAIITKIKENAASLKK